MLTLPSVLLSWRKLILLILLYFGFGFFYMVSLYLSYSATVGGSPSYAIIYLDYPLKALFTLPIYYLLFRVLAHWSLERKLLLNLALMPVWIKGWQWTYYWITDTFTDRYHLEGAGEWWDVYIPGLFYVLQFGIFHAWDNYERLLQREREKAEMQRLALASELDALKAQLNPHFLYNSLNTISASLEPSQENSRRMIAQLSDLFRYQLVANRRDRVRLVEELDFVRDYLQLEKERFGERLFFRIDPTDDMSVQEALIPPLLLQPLVENAVRHGVSPSIIGGEVVVTARAADGNLHLTVFNTGAPLPEESATREPGFGLGNTCRRLELLYGAQLKLYSTADGTFCQFSIPLHHVSDHSPDRRRATNGVEALTMIRALRPDVIFLDVQMPGKTGLEVLAELEELPYVVFSTAFDQYALEAFDLHAVDYLLKPYTAARFDLALGRLRERVSKQRQVPTARLAQHLRERNSPTNYPDRIMVDRGGKYVALPVSELLYVSADGDYSCLVTAQRSYLSTYNLKETEARLDPNDFLRIHRSTIVNRGAIREIHREGHGYGIVLTNGTVVRASRGYAARIKGLLF